MTTNPQHTATDDLERQVIHNVNPFSLAGPFATTPSMARLPGPAIHGRPFGRFDEITDLVEKDIRSHPRQASASQAREPGSPSGLRPLPLPVANCTNRLGVKPEIEK